VVRSWEFIRKPLEAATAVFPAAENRSSFLEPWEKIPKMKPFTSYFLPLPPVKKKFRPNRGEEEQKKENIFLSPGPQSRQRVGFSKIPPLK
jgi:hypothetical protein